MENDWIDHTTIIEKSETMRVAVVGSGLAGQTIAYLLQNDPQKRYSVEVFERGEKPSLAAASISLPNQAQEAPTVIDVPMRAFTGGFYRNLIAMYDYLQVQYHEHKFRFVFAKRSSGDAEAGAKYRTYFIQTSDARGIPAVKPADMSFFAYCLDYMYVVMCVWWLTFTFWLIATPHRDESFEAYLKRWRAPRRFVDEYLLPLLSAIATCSHEELLQFPASDIVQYRNSVRSQKQYLVTDGIKMVQDRLMAGLTLHTQVRVSRVESKENAVMMSIETLNADGKMQTTVQVFDKVILAVSPDMSAEIFSPAQTQLVQIPVRIVNTVAHPQNTGERSFVDCDEIILNTSFQPEGWTEATHVHNCGLAVTSCWKSMIVGGTCVSTHQFTRTLRTPKSREIVQNMFQTTQKSATHGQQTQMWRNGDGNVWMAGAWCWDGMVLLEGAVVSAMQVAKALGVDVPWEEINSPSTRSDN